MINRLHVVSPRQTAIYVMCPSDHDILHVTIGAVVMPSKGWDKNRRWYKAAKSESPSDRKSVPTYVVSQTSLLWIPNLKWAALKRGLAQLQYAKSWRFI